MQAAALSGAYGGYEESGTSRGGSRRGVPQRVSPSGIDGNWMMVAGDGQVDWEYRHK
jgi:hypothetical protein